jgi:hypothetical protein
VDSTNESRASGYYPLGANAYAFAHNYCARIKGRCTIRNFPIGHLIIILPHFLEIWNAFLLLHTLFLREVESGIVDGLEKVNGKQASTPLKSKGALAFVSLADERETACHTLICQGFWQKTTLPNPNS